MKVLLNWLYFLFIIKEVNFCMIVLIIYQYGTSSSYLP